MILNLYGKLSKFHATFVLWILRTFESTRSKKGEKLAVKITEDLPLTAKDESVLLLKKGSSFTFDNRTGSSK